MSQLEKDAKILTEKKVDDNPSTDGKVMSNRTAGSQGLRKFDKTKFNSIIKKKADVAPEVILPVVQDAVETEEPKVVSIAIVTAEAHPQPVIKTKDAILEEVADPQVVPSKVETKPIQASQPEVVLAKVETKPIFTPAPVAKDKPSEVTPIAKTQAVSASPVVQKEPVQSKAHVITSEIPRQPTVITTVTPQESHVKATASTRNSHDNNHVKTHADRGFKGSHVVDESIIFNIHSLPKYHRVIMDFMFRKCSQTGTNKTSHIFTNELLGMTGMKPRTYEDALARLLEDQILTLVDVRKGRSGFRTFTIHPTIFSQLMQESRNPNKHHANNHVESHGFAPSKEVSKFNNNITNYTQQPNVVLNKNFNFKDLDFTEVAPLHPMQVNSSIRKLAEEKLEKEEMQLFVDKFMVWMSTQKNVQSVIGLFVSKIKEYIEEGDSPVMQCMSKKELIAEVEFKQKADQLARQQQMTEKYKNEIATNAMDERFSDWISSLSNEDKVSFVPESNLAKLGSAAHSGALKAYFIENLNNNQ